jgi:hypothetical protein
LCHDNEEILKKEKDKPYFETLASVSHRKTSKITASHDL